MSESFRASEMSTACRSETGGPSADGPQEGEDSKAAGETVTVHKHASVRLTYFSSATADRAEPARITTAHAVIRSLSILVPSSFSAMAPIMVVVDFEEPVLVG